MSTKLKLGICNLNSSNKEVGYTVVEVMIALFVLAIALQQIGTISHHFVLLVKTVNEESQHTSLLLSAYRKELLNNAEERYSTNRSTHDLNTILPSDINVFRLEVIDDPEIGCLYDIVGRRCR